MKNGNSFHRLSSFSPRIVTKIVFFFTGLASLLWFLIRVIPKPSRAVYPCQRVAFPVATAFLIWLSGIITSSFIYTRAKANWRRMKYGLAGVLCFLAVIVFLFSTTPFRYTPAMAVVYDIKTTLFGSSMPPLLDNLSGDGTTVEPSAIVGVTKSSEAHAEDIEFEEISAMVSEAIEKAGGLEGIVSDGDTVILKPNLVVCRDESAARDTLVPEVNGITTDYRVMQAVVNAVRQLNPTGAVYVMEGSAAGSTYVNMSILNYDQITGIDGLLCLEEICGEWQDTTSIYLQGVSLPPDKVLYEGADNRYWLNKLYYDADALISVPVLKNHWCAGITGAVKNVGIGGTPPSIYGMGPGHPDPGYRAYRIDHGSAGMPRNNLHNWIHDFYMCRPVDFVIMDGLQGIENGPTCSFFLNGTQEISEDQMNMRMILASSDPIAIDAVASLLAGHDPLMIRHLVTLHNDTLGCNDSRLIRVDGIKVGDEKQDFETGDSGSLSKYDDFESPALSVDTCYVSDNELHFNLIVDDEVNKVEVTIDGTYLDEIILEDFEDCFVDLDTFVVTENTEVGVYAYDQYLNYSSQYVNPYMSADTWPGDSGTEIGYGLPDMTEPTGIVWHGRLGKLFLVHDDGWVISMNTDGSDVSTWESSGIFKGIAVADQTTDYLYIGVEHPDEILEFDIRTGSLTGSAWDLTPWMSGYFDLGLEALTFVPNGHHPYASSSSGGLFYAGLQEDGSIYVFDVDLSQSGSVSFVDVFKPAEVLTDISGLHYESRTETLYAVYDSWNILLELETDGSIMSWYELPGANQNGVTVVPFCPSTIAEIYIAEDKGEVWGYGNYPVDCIYPHWRVPFLPR